MKSPYSTILLLSVFVLLLGSCRPVATALPEPPRPTAPPPPTAAPAQPPTLELMQTSAPIQAAETADLVLKSGFVYTVDKDRTVAQAVAVKDDLIVYVGDDAGAAQWIGPQTKVIDLKGKMVLPGFIDSHAHAADATTEVFEVSLSGLGNVDEYKQAIQDFLAAYPGLGGVQGAGWINGYFPPSGPTKDILDELAPDIPVILYSEDYHSTWVNSKALEMAGVTKDTPNPEGGIIERDAQGNPSGTLRETAQDLVAEVMPPYTVDQYIEAMKYFEEMAHSFGITTVFIPSMLGADNAFVALQQLDKSSQLTVRYRTVVTLDPEDNPATVVPEVLALQRQEKGGLLEVNSVKIFMDGVIEGGTAYLEEPYVHQPDSRGELLWDPQAYNEMCAALEKAGIQIHVHAIGDAAVRITLDGFAYARQQNGAGDHRHAITHIQLVSPADVKRFAELGVTAVPQPYWFVVDVYYDQAVEYLGQARSDQQYPMKSFFDAGALVASASDYPVTIPPQPLTAIQIGVTRAALGEEGMEDRVLVPAERVSVEDMIASFTINGAYANFLENVTGSLEVGKKADIIVLAQNLLELDPSEISAVQVLLTIFEGQEVFRHESFVD